MCYICSVKTVEAVSAIHTFLDVSGFGLGVVDEVTKVAEHRLANHFYKLRKVCKVVACRLIVEVVVELLDLFKFESFEEGVDFLAEHLFLLLFLAE